MGALGNGDGDGAYCLFGEENGALGEGGGSALADVVCAGDALDEGGGGEGARLGGELVGGVEGQGQGAAAAEGEEPLLIPLYVDGGRGGDGGGVDARGCLRYGGLDGLLRGVSAAADAKAQAAGDQTEGAGEGAAASAVGDPDA